MKATGIIRKLDNLGRIVIPSEIRNSLDIDIKDSVEIFIHGSSIVLKKFKPSCIFCDSTTNLHEYKEKLVCENCAKKLHDEI